MNTNCLEGKRCPNCKQEDEILILTPMWVSLRDDGTDPFADSLKNKGDVEYDENTLAGCPECHFLGTIKDFNIKKTK
jgi:hypothetical protein